MFKLSKFEKLQKEENAKPFKPMIDDLINCTDAEFLQKVEGIKEWYRVRDDLYIWIPVLNRIDSILSALIKKYSYGDETSQNSSKKIHRTKLLQMNDTDENIVVILTSFTCRLLYNTENRYLYSSLDVMNALLNCPNFKVKYGAIKVVAIVGERYVVARERLESIYKVGLPELRNKALQLALALPSSMTDDDAEHFSIVDIFTNKKPIPKKLGKFKYTYYAGNENKNNKKVHSSTNNNNNNTKNANNTNNNNNIKNTNNTINSQPLNSSMKKFVLSKEDLQKLTLQQIFDKGMNCIPPDSWYDFSLKVTVAKAFSESTPETNALRDLIIRTKLIAVAFINTVYIPPHVSSKLFEVDPYLFNALNDFITLAEKPIPGQVRVDALFTLECISLKHIWCADIMRKLSGNLSHGELFQVLRQIGKLLRTDIEEGEDFSEEYNVRFFYLISNLSEVKSLHDSLLNAGLIPTLLEIVSSNNKKFKRTLASATHLLEVFINDAESTSEFVTYNGFTMLINTIADQVEFALNEPNPNIDAFCPTNDYTISFRQQAFIKSLLKLVLRLLRTDSGDRIRNLIDSPILVSLLKILQNMSVFGSTLITFTLDVVQRIINSEPTIYQVLVEAGLIPYIINNFSTFIAPYSDLLFLLPDVISALCLNAEGLKQVKEKNMIQNLFDIMLDLKYAKVLSWREEATELGSSIDELSRHYPELKPIIFAAFSNTLKKIPEHIKFDQKYVYDSTTGSDLFYHSKDEEVINDEENAGRLAFWEEQPSTVILDCFSNLFYGITFESSTIENLHTIISMEDLISAIIVDKLPFDYCSSQAMLNITDVLQILDEQHQDSVFPLFMEHLDKKLKGIKDFLHSDCSSSFFLSMKNGEDHTYQEHILGELSGISALLHVITTVYVTLMSLSNERVKQILNLFVNGNVELIENLTLLFQKSAFEEMYIRSALPDEVNTQTTPEAVGHVPPIHIHSVKPAKRELKDDFTSAKFKNTFQARHLLNKIQGGISIIFKSFLRLNHTVNKIFPEQNKAIRIMIFENVIKKLVEMLRLADKIDNVSYLLILLHFNTYVMTYPKTTMTNSEVLQTLPAYLFYQYGGYDLYIKLLKKLFSKIMLFEDVEAIEKIDFVQNKEEILIMSSVINIMSFLNKSIQFETMEDIKSIKLYYSEAEDYHVTGVLIKQLTMRTILLLLDLNNSFNIFDPKKRVIPYAVFKQILSVWKNCYSHHHEEFTEDPLMIEWDMITPSERKFKVLEKCGVTEETAKRYLENNENKLPPLTATEESNYIFDDKKWKTYREEMKNADMESFKLKHIVDPKLEDRSLYLLRATLYQTCMNKKIFHVLPFYPKLVNAFAKMLLVGFQQLDRSVVNFVRDILETIETIDPTDEAVLSSLMHLFGIFLNEKTVLQQSEDTLALFLDYLQKVLVAKDVNTAWFSKMLYSYEIILSKSVLPRDEAIRDEALAFPIPTLVPIFNVEHSIKQRIFSTIIRVNDITNFYSALAILRILLIYARNDDYAADIISSQIIPKLLKVIGVFQKSEKINFLESSFLLLLRRCFEHNVLVSNLIEHEVHKCFTGRSLGVSSETPRQLLGLLEEKSHIALRNPELFTEILCKNARFDQFTEDGRLVDFTLRRYNDDKSSDKREKSDAVVTTAPTGIVHLLLSQLMAASKKDWLSEPIGNDTKTTTGKEAKPDPSRNPVCAYMIFLLKVLTELICSYKQCKFEFLTYDRRNTYVENPKPKATALNFFLYQLLDKSSVHEQNKDEAKRREVISTLAVTIILGFITSPYDEDLSKKTDLKDADPDMTFIRKFTIEVFIKALRSSVASAKTLEDNVSKLDCWFSTIAAMVYVQAPYLKSLINSAKIDSDRYQICRLMIDLGVPSSVTDCMAKLDLNYPFCKKLFNDAVEALNAINATRKDFADLFKVESHDEEDDVDEESDKEEVSDMFKNSALSMYDLEDIEEEDPEEDEDSLIGDNEDIAFVDSDEEGYEVVFSDESGAEEDAEDEDIVMEIDPSASDDDLSVHSRSDSLEGDIYSGDDFHSDGAESLSHIAEDNSNGTSDSEMEIDISDYDIDDIAWDSGFTSLSSSDDGEDDSSSIGEAAFGNEIPSRSANGRTIWSLGDGVELEEDEELADEQRGIFQGIQHVFNPDDQALLRIQTPTGHGRTHNHNRTLRRRSHAAFGSPSLSFLNGTRRNQSNLINPLGPSGLEQVENDISDQLTTVGTGVRPRSARPHFADMLFSGELFDERVLENIVLKSTIARWKDIFDMFYESKNYATYLFSAIVNRLYKPSLELYKEELEKTATSKPEKRARDEIDDLAAEENDRNDMNLSSDASESSLEHMETDEGNPQEQHTEHEPVFVEIQGEDVDIGGTDIDPEFLRALPENMRAEVFAQHVRERRLQARENNTHSRELESDFLSAIPDDIRDEILVEEGFNNVLRRVHWLRTGDRTNVEDNQAFRFTANNESDSEGGDDSEHGHEGGHESDSVNDSEGDAEPHDTHLHSSNGETEESAFHISRIKDKNEKKKSDKVYFEPLLDKTGISALMKSLFISQPYFQREIYHDLFCRLCGSKQNRSDIINLLLMILAEGAIDQNSLEKVYNVIVNRSNGLHKSQGPVRQLPLESTPLVVANQAIEILQYLIDTDSKLKFFFITEHESLMLNKTSKDASQKSSKLPIRYLISLLDRKLITDENLLMDLLTSILQICTKPLESMIKTSKDPHRKSFQIPSFESDELKKIVSIITLDSCGTKVFQQTLSIMFNMIKLHDTLKLFTDELIDLACKTSESLIKDIQSLTKEIKESVTGVDIDVELIQKLTLPNSEQSKLLKILTAVDYLYSHKKKEYDNVAETLIDIYNKMNLGQLWVSLSDCMLEVESKKKLATSSNVLLPVIEALMVVCKHCKVSKSPHKITKYEEDKDFDFSKLSVEELFFPFTDLHKKLLNQMVRSNPKLMSGPFSMLVKNPKILDFDNKRYYFVAKLGSDTHERGKLQITVTREQVFLDSYRSLFFKNVNEIKQSKLEITFKGESGVDAGGLTREWYQVLSRQMFNPDYALFLPVASDKTTFHPNRTSSINPEHLSFFKFVGIIIGKAIHDQCYLDCHFSREVYKNILNKPVALKDMESVDPDYYKSLVWILENDITDIIEETFSVETDDYGEHNVIDLIPDGRNIAVTEENKQEYVKTIVEYKLNVSVKEQMDNFLIGFFSLIPKELISIFDEQEIELLISGLPDIDVDDWKNNTTYVNYTASCKQVNYFWRAVKSFDLEERAKLLQFVTGTSKVPLNGFKELSGVNGICKFSIHRDYGSNDRLPSSHTCFNQLNLPSYNSYETLRGSLLIAINEGHEGFGLA